MDHLSDLKLADSDFGIPPRIDLLLGAEVFTNILCDGRRTGPGGMPSALNTCFGWVLFGKIGRTDVVNMANHTLEQLVLLDERETRHSYAAVLTAGKNKALRCTGRRKKRSDEGQQPLVPRRECIPEGCGILRHGFNRTKISQSVRNNGCTRQIRWETRRFRPAGCWCQNATK